MTASPAIEPLVEFDRLLAAIRLRRRQCAAFALTGLGLGLMISLVLPPQPAASAQVLIARADDQKSNRGMLMTTDVALCGSDEVAAGAAATLGMDPVALVSSYSCTSTTVNVLKIVAKAPTAGGAERTAQAVVDSFIARHLGRTERSVNAQVDELLMRRARLERGLAQVLSSLAVADSAERVSSLSTVRTGLMAQIDDLTSRGQDLRSTYAVVHAGTEVVDPARAVATGAVQRFGIPAGMGLVLGLGAGLGLAALAGVVRDRPYRRRDIARALHAPVLLDLARRPRGLVGPSRDYEVSAAAATVARLVRAAPTIVSVLELGCPRAGVALVAGVAEQLTPRRTVLLAESLHRALSDQDLTRLQARARIVRPGAAVPAVGGQDALDLGFGTISSRTGWVELQRLGSLTILVVRAGHATDAVLQAVARHLAQAEIEVLGVVLVDADPKDHSDGAACDEFYAVMRRHLGWLQASGVAGGGAALDPQPGARV